MTPHTRIVFFGGNRLSVMVLEKLIEKNIKPNLIIASPNKPVGKKKTVFPPPLKLTAENLRLTVLQPKSLKNNRDLVQKITSLKPDLGIVAAYGKIIPKEVLDLFPKGVLNLHPSLLPKHRGPSPIQTALLENDFDTGVSVILLDEQMDHGQILTQETVKLTGEEYFKEVYEKLANLGGKLLAKTIPLWIDKQITPRAQNESKATICKKLEWKDGKIDVDDSVEQTFAKIRALGQEPGAWIEFPTKNKELNILKIIRAKPIIDDRLPTAEIGLSRFDQDLILIRKNGVLLLEQVQPEGKRVMTGKEFLNGHKKLLTGENY